eukprot:UN02263
MNDGGRPVTPMLEVHLRNAIRIPSKPLWHTLHAGTCERDVKVGEWKRYEGYRDISDLAKYYDKSGVGNIHFKPCIGLEPLREEKPYSDAYANWHPGSIGHRMYAEVIAYEYITALKTVLEDLQDDIVNAVGHDITQRSRSDLLKLLKDPQMEPVPEPLKCGAYCDHSSICITGFRPIMPRWELQKFCWTYHLGTKSGCTRSRCKWV